MSGETAADPGTAHADPAPQHDRVMLVTGGARGIGAAIARAGVAAGYRVVVTYQSSNVAAADLVTYGGAHAAIRCDAGEEPAVVASFAEVVARFGHVDALVNNAGIAGSYGTIDGVTAEMLTRLWAVNVSGPFLYAREAVRHMSTSSGGRGGAIVNITSKAAVLGGSGEWVHYAASKAALETMTVGLAKEVATQGIRVNAVRPGLIETDFDRLLAPGRRDRLRPAIPMQRSGLPEEVAAAVIWLCSDAASYTTAAVLDVTGGR